MSTSGLAVPRGILDHVLDPRHRVQSTQSDAARWQRGGCDFRRMLEDVPGLSEGQVLYRDPHWTRQSPDRKFFLSWAHDKSPSSEKCPWPRSVFMIYLGRIDGGPARVLAPVRSGEVFTWAPDSRKFAYSRMNGPDVRTVTGLAPRVPSTQVVVAEIDGTEEEVVLEKAGYWTASDWSPDGNRLLLIYDPTRSP